MWGAPDSLARRYHAGCGETVTMSLRRGLVTSTCFRTGNRWLQAANRGHEPKIKTPQGQILRLLMWGAPDSLARRYHAGCGETVAMSLRRWLVTSTCFRTGNRWLQAANRGHEPKIKTPQGRFNFWLGRTDSNHDKENQNLLSYH